MKTKTSFTPGPWHFGIKKGAERTDGSDWGADGLWSSDNKMILGSGSGWDSEYVGPSEANARLIAAAPELLLALKRLLYAFENDDDDDAAEQAFAAITKAESR